LLLYHFVCIGKYRCEVFTSKVGETLKFLYEEIGKRYEIYTIEIVSDENPVHFLLQSVLTYSAIK